METAICGRITLSANQLLNPKSGDKLLLLKGTCPNRGTIMMVSASGPGKGGGLLERPTIEKTSPGRESEFDLRKNYLWTVLSISTVLTEAPKTMLGEVLGLEMLQTYLIYHVNSSKKGEKGFSTLYNC
ncbi:ATP-dependent Clp protease adapter protein CLPS1, chloroplastic isoform X2 [Amborella trichopoda]|uniref:ATP-dependent Clp protease adapter protein CLPS1, chloroplastic isoform X2 n=1 Tax=Amborella trichopoda TaxID=13333 RepID=UPI0009BC9D22|nr:ATP-dependent Clp protease adapter protein CLPS1, chloroplastic isoform X2 [Amborella trichopoda]|eukprot:XP_020519916.1 ATP-dependent Clp protease adapter protein CLPS1, chloroplastic isoform X2 [Amborella trichopoda]